MTSNVHEWIKKEESRRKILMTIKQPLTGKQIGRRTGIPIDTCSYVVAKLVTKGLLTCLNPEARNSRLYWLTDLAIQCRKRLHQDLALAYEEYDLPSIDWSLYGWICFSHRSIVMKTLTAPMQPSEIKRTIRKKKAGTKISANNIRDVVKLLLEKGIVQKVHVRKKAHPRYELTDSGNKLREILMQSEMTF
jgi:DNA-binding MarR family transcriptional regulator